jgi:hypothetical protein
MESRLTLPQQVNALVDVIIGGNPFTKSYVVDIDGNVSTIYTPTTIQSYTIPCATTVTGLVSYMFDFLSGALFNDLTLYVEGTQYPKNSIVRYGVNDYVALSITGSQPGSDDTWALIRTNQLGPQGPAGQSPIYTA